MYHVSAITRLGKLTVENRRRERDALERGEGFIGGNSFRYLN